MKAIYMMLSGIILSVVATIAIAGLISISKLIKPAESKYVANRELQYSQIKIIHQQELCQHNDENPSETDFIKAK